jgi:hypothetical protein
MNEETTATDALLSQRLAEAEPAVVSGWALLAARLELIGQRREMISCVKVTEAALLLSALLLFFRLPEAPQADSPLARLTSPFPVALPHGPSAPVDHSPVASMISASEAIAPRPEGARVAVTLIPSLPAPPIPTKPELPVVRRGAFGPVAVSGQGVTLFSTSVRPLLRLPGIQPPQPIRYYLNLFVSPLDVNQVVTLANPNLGINDRIDLSTGFSVGALVDIEQGDNALQTGLIYGYRSYIPAEILQLNDRGTQDPDREAIRYGRLKYRTASFPLNYYRTFRTTEKWRISGGLGASMNVILSAEFQLGEGVTQKDLVRELNTFRETAREEGLPKSLNGIGATNRFINPTVGILDGGGFLDNSSLYLGGSLRVERLVSDRWSLYFSPTFTRLFTVRDNDGGKGPLADRIHNTMLRAGARVRLTDK